MKKRISALVLALCLLLGSTVCANALGTNSLHFDENGEFRILHICDCQDTFPAQQNMLIYIDYMLTVYEPDLVVLGGDNCIAPQEIKEDAIEELVQPFVNRKVPFTLVFGNHDAEQGYTNEQLLEMYQRYGGEYCLAYDADPEISGTAAHNLPVFASDSNEIKFNLWMFDTGDYIRDEHGNSLGYDSVKEDQIGWYNETYADLRELTGKRIYSLAFQHMAVGEVYDAMFPSVPLGISPLTESYNGGKNYPVFLPDTSAFKGHIYEPPSPGVYNHGQVDAMLKNGDVLGVLFGHDHVNSYETDYEGIKLINTPGATLYTYGNELVRGSRLITINENNTDTFESEVITYNRLALENSDFAADTGIHPISAAFYSFAGNLLLLLKNVSAIFASVVFLFN